tara:strand:- start:75 stop:428 length:354 start_codon:yes stop_codon:yes gene_type:complete
MKVFKKIGLGFISLGLISTFYIPEAKANLTLFEFTYPNDFPVLGGRTYAMKLVTSLSGSPSDKQLGKFLMKRVGSGNTFCTKWITSVSTLAAFTSCVEKKLGNDMMTGLINSAISSF